MFDDFTGLYSLQKTLRFELKPVGETADYIDDFKSEYLKGVVKQDEQRAEDYKAVKKLIDEYHRAYIEERLAEPVDKETGELLTCEDFEESYSYYQRFRENPKDKKAQEGWKSEQERLRKKLVKAFADNGSLFSKELIKSDLPEWLKAQGRWDENCEVVESFNKFTTYFTGFHDNRKNMYSPEEQATAIAYRLMNENLPKFFGNCVLYRSIRGKHSDFSLSADEALLKKMEVASLDEVFMPGYFFHLRAQSGIDNFQELINGKAEEDRSKVRGLNEQINLYRQQRNLKARELPAFVALYKQILSDRESRSFIPDAFENDREMLNALAEYVQQASADNGLIEALKDAMAKLPEADYSKTYFKGSDLTSVSQALFGSYGILISALRLRAESEHPAPANGKVSNKLEKEREGYLKQEAYSLAELDNALIAYIEQLDADDNVRDKASGNQPMLSYFATALREPVAKLDVLVTAVKPLLALEALNKKRSAPKDDNDSGAEGFQQVQAIQKMLDGFMAVSQAVKPLHLVKGRKPIEMPDADIGFYSPFAEAFEAFSGPTIDLYNKVRNHLTKKPSAKDKVKINFEAPTLLNGWDLNKETDNKSVILRSGENYFLAIMHPKHSRAFVDCPAADDGEEIIEKMNYKLLSGANKMLPKVFFSAKGKEAFQPPQDILELYERGEHKKGGSFKLESCRRLIDFFKAKMPLYKVHPSDEFGWDVFGFKFSPTESYEDLSGFYREVESQGYKLWFSDVPKRYVDDMIKQGKLFLFQIYNKDFSKFSKGKPNLHTLYWRGLFEPENLKDVVLKLNGEAEMFYRQHSIKRDERTIHPANQPVTNKNELNPKKESTFEYDLIKDRRYTKDKFFFHVPVSLNFKAQGVARFNDRVNQAVAKAENVHVIGIDRGERHLLYYTVVNQKGEIVEQGSLNRVATDQGYSVDYQQKLHAREKAREQARKSWSSVENIKELKAGYLSHVVHRLAELIVRHNAIVCLEDLNFGFKRGRFKVEKQVYQKFERALIDKLNYLVFKERDAKAPGGYLNAYQLTAPFESFQKLGKQSGILYYVGAAYTSKIDPATGYIDFLHPGYESVEKAQIFFGCMESIRFNSEKDYFEFEFDYEKYPVRQNLSGYQTRWTVCTHGDVRYHNQRDDKGVWHSNPVNVTAKLKTLFEDNDIEYKQGQELQGAIVGMSDKSFFSMLMWLLRLTMSLRHSVSNSEEDFILSPVADENGNFFDSRKASDQQPKDADANGAYHIALKGLWNLKQIRGWDGEGRLNLAMKNEEWFGFAVDKLFRK